MRIGFGVDSHEFETEKQKALMLGGIKVEQEGVNGLKGNSDADVILHAIFNSISSACGKKSIGAYSDKMCLEQGITNSAEYLKVAKGFLKEKKFIIANLSIALECKKPKIDLIAEKIKQRISEILEIKPEQIGITATSGEELTAFGQGKGIFCWSNLLLKKNNKQKNNKKE